MLIRTSELITTYDYEIESQDKSLNFRLEIYSSSGIFIGKVFRSDLYRIKPTFSEEQNINFNKLADELIFVRDDYFDEKQLTGKSVNDVISIFLERLNFMFNI